MTWREAWKLTLALLGDPSSRVAASVAGWSEPWDREALILADLYDRFVEANTAKKDQGKIKPYPRPFDTREKQRSSRPTVDQATIRAALAERGHD